MIFLSTDEAPLKPLIVSMIKLDDGYVVSEINVLVIMEARAGLGLCFSNLFLDHSLFVLPR